MSCNFLSCIGFIVFAFSLFAMEDIDPKAFDFDPSLKKDARQEADFAAVQFLAKLIYENENSEEAVAIEENPPQESDIDETIDIESDLFVPGTQYDKAGTTTEYREPLPVMIQEGNRQVITHFPQQAILSPYERGEYKSEERAFYISRKAVTNREWKKFITATSRTAPAYWPKEKMSADFKDQPVVNITHEEAASFATWVKKRLPTLAEYERAVRQFPFMRRSSPVREWTATPTKNSDHIWLVFGGGELEGAYRDQQTGFRVAHFPDQ